MWICKEPKLMRWLEQNPDRTEQLRIDTTDKNKDHTPDLIVLDAEPDYEDVVAMLVDCGVQPVDAKRYVTSVVKHPNEGTFWEVYGKGILGRAALRQTDINIVGLMALDLRSRRPDGQHWDFTR